MFSRRDRVELSVLGLVVLAWGLLVSPLLHSLAHAHAHGHEHGAPARSTGHGAGSLEHHAAAFLETPAHVELTSTWLLVSRSRPLEPRAPWFEHVGGVELAQGP